MASFASILQSGSIRLLVDDNQEFIAHRALLAEHLPNLSLPSRERYVQVDGDAESIGYLLEYLYTGDYTPSLSRAQPEKIHEDVKPIEETKQEEVHPIVLASRTSGLGVWGKPAALHTTAFHEPSTKEGDYYSHPSTFAGSSSLAEGSTISTQASGNFGTTFLVHAKVYLIAERYGAEPLKNFSLQKLRAQLKTSDIEPSADRTSNVISLIRNIYDLPASYNPSTTKNLRQIVVAHAMSHLPELQSNEAFSEYVKQGGDFVADLFSNLSISKF